MRRVLVVGLMIALSGAGVWAQEPPPVGAQPPPQRPAGRGQRGGPPLAGQGNPQQLSRQVQEMLDVWALSAARRRLQLSGDQYPVFFQKFQDLQGLRQRHRMQRLRLINELRQLTRPGVTTEDATLGVKTKALDDLELTWAQEEARALSSVDQVLTAMQRARFRIFEEEMELQKLELIAQVKGSGVTPPKPAPGAGRK